MKQFEYVVTDKEGIHARPAGLLVREAGKYKSSITLDKDGKTADAKRIFAVMGLTVKCGQNVAVRVEGEDEEAAAAAIEAFFRGNL